MFKERTQSFLRKHGLWVAIIAAFFLIIIIVVVIIGGATNDCGSGDGDGASGNWQWPFDGVKDPPQYGDGGQFGVSAASAIYRNGHTFHDGFDWSFGMNGVHAGSTVKAVHDGTVKTVAYAEGLDEYVWVQSDDGYNEVYQETFDKSDIKVKEGDHVNAGDVIGTAHLHGHMHLGITKESDFNKAESKAFTNDGTWLDPIKVIEQGMKSSGSSKNGSGSSAGGSSGNLNGNAKIIFDYFTKKLGFSGAGAAGVVGNAYAESGFDPKANGGNVVGIFQWGAGGINGDRLHSGGIIKSNADLTLSKELQLAAYELNHKFSSVKAKVGHATDPTKAADDWVNDYEIAPGQATAKREAAARQAYSQFGGSKIKANDSLLGSSASGADVGGQGSDSSANCDDGDDAGSADGNIVSVAKSLLGYFTYGQTHGISNIGSVAHPNKNGVTDCSGFVWLVLTKAGYSTPANMGWFTGTMAQDAKGPHKWLKQIKPSEARAGDVIICNQGSGEGDAGHTAILEEKWKGGDTKIIQEGGTGGMGGVNESNVSMSFGSLFTNGDVVLARPVKK